MKFAKDLKYQIQQHILKLEMAIRRNNDPWAWFLFRSARSQTIDSYLELMQEPRRKDGNRTYVTTLTVHLLAKEFVITGYGRTWEQDGIKFIECFQHLPEEEQVFTSQEATREDSLAGLLLLPELIERIA